MAPLSHVEGTQHLPIGIGVQRAFRLLARGSVIALPRLPHFLRNLIGLFEPIYE